MSKRNLTRQQQARIDKNLQRKLRQAEKDRLKTSGVSTTELGHHGLVTTHYGQHVVVEDDAGVRHTCRFRANLSALVVGDQVVFQPPTESSAAVITATRPRQNLLSRPDNYGNLKPVAANVDRLFIVFAEQPLPSSQLLDRYLVAAELANIPVTLLVNKADLASDLVASLIAIYRTTPYPIVTTSCQTGHGMDKLKQQIANQNIAFVGQSGVGKSSLINALLPDATLATNTLSTSSGLGQHTTVTAQLLSFPGGGHLIDSPGIREFGLWHISPEQLLQGYVELAELAGHCKFRNCQHRNEPGCALHQAVNNGDVHPQRLHNYFAIADTLDEDSRARY